MLFKKETILVLQLESVFYVLVCLKPNIGLMLMSMLQRVMVSPMLFPDSKVELKLEKREPLKGRAKTPVTLKQRRIEHNQVSSFIVMYKYKDLTVHYLSWLPSS